MAPRQRFASCEITDRLPSDSRSTRRSQTRAHGALHAARYGPDRPSMMMRSDASADRASSSRGAHQVDRTPRSGRDTPIARRWSGMKSLGERTPKSPEKIDTCSAPVLAQAFGAHSTIASYSTPVNRDEAGAQGAESSAVLTERSILAPTFRTAAASGPSPRAASESHTLRRLVARLGRDSALTSRDGPCAGAFFPSDGGNQISMVSTLSRGRDHARYDRCGSAGWAAARGNARGTSGLHRAG